MTLKIYIPKGHDHYILWSLWIKTMGFESGTSLWRFWGHSQPHIALVLSIAKGFNPWINRNRWVMFWQRRGLESSYRFAKTHIC